MGELAAIGGKGLEIGGSLFSGFQARKTGKSQARRLQTQSRLEEEAAEFDALQSGREFDKLLGRQRVAIAASGAELSGSPLLILDETLRDKEETIQNILKTGSAKSSFLRSKGKAARRTGRDALIASILGIGGEF